jgi:hypothetical protein
MKDENKNSPDHLSKDVLCKGSIVLGTACMHCTSCYEDYTNLYLNSLKRKYVHIKTGNVYYTMDFTVDTSANEKDKIKILYCKEDTIFPIYSKNIMEFWGKFAPLVKL